MSRVADHRRRLGPRFRLPWTTSPAADVRRASAADGAGMSPACARRASSRGTQVAAENAQVDLRKSIGRRAVYPYRLGLDKVQGSPARPCSDCACRIGLVDENEGELFVMPRATNRMPPIAPESMTDAQKKAVAEIVSGPRGHLVGPFIPLLRSPDFMGRL